MKQKLQIFLIIVFSFLSASWAKASEPSDFAKYFEVDLDAPIPDLQALEHEFEKATDVYNPRYLLSWDMGTSFDPIWVATITKFGLSETRIKAPGEDSLYDMIKAMPPEYYPYIGPQLHISQGISEKIVNMPGIKETKHQFPSRIAPQLADIEDLQFLSPQLYLLLMPEVWPSNIKPTDAPRRRPAQLPRVYTPQNVFQNAFANVPENGFGGRSRTEQGLSADNLRTLHITKTSPLTSADVLAFLDTLDGVESFGTLSNLVKISHAGALLDFWEQLNGKAIPLNGLKDAVNPCQRLVLKMKWAGIHNQFAQKVGAQGFDVDEWAYTCDKTIKAFRVARISSATLILIKNYKKGVYRQWIDPLKPFYRDNQYASMQAVIEMNKAPKQDVLTALKNERAILEKLRPFGNTLLTAPIAQ